MAAGGDNGNGGDCSYVQSQLAGGVQAIHSTVPRLPSLKEDDSVIAWSNDNLGGDCSSVQGQLTGGVTTIQSTR